MSDPFVPRQGHHPVSQDRPTICLTAAERKAFASISQQLDRRHRATVAITNVMLRLPLLQAGIGTMVVGSVWILGWLAVSVPISFAGVLMQAAGAGLVIQWTRVGRIQTNPNDPLGVATAAASGDRPPGRL